MKWVNTLGVFELSTVAAFAAFYLLFLIRAIRSIRRMGSNPMLVVVKMLVRAGYFALIIISLLGPSIGEASREVKTVGKDIFFCIDLSQSMNATDVQPSRLTRIKFELKNIVEAFNQDRIGLIMFSSEAYMQCPLTYDNNALNLFIQTLNTRMVPSYGTDFGPPLELAIEKLTNDDTIVTQSKSKTIILVSDGEDFGDDTERIAEEVADAGIALFTLGVGTKNGSKIPVRTGFKTDNDGKEVVSKLNPSSLKTLASDANGKYFEINESRNDVQRLISAINDIEGEMRDSKKIDAEQNRFYYFLMGALLLMVIDALFHVKLIKI